MDKVLFDEKITDLVSGLDDRVINKITPLFVSKYSLQAGIQCYQPALFAKVLDDIKHNNSDEILLLCKKVLLLGVVLNNWQNLDQLQMGGEYKTYLERIYQLTGVNSENSLASFDVFWKELAIARLQFFPIKSGVVEFYSGFGFRQGLSFNLFDSFKFLAFIAQFGRKPYYRTHLHTPLINHFSAEGWHKSYHQIAEVLQRNNHIKGLVRTSWYFDPYIKVISPHLSYLQDLPMKHGAQLFCLGPDESGCALVKSKQRVRLFNGGRYVPMNYLLVWPREALIAWSKANKEYEL